MWAEAVELNQRKLCLDAGRLELWLPSDSAYLQVVPPTESPSVSHAEAIQRAMDAPEQVEQSRNAAYEDGNN